MRWLDGITDPMDMSLGTLLRKEWDFETWNKGVWIKILKTFELLDSSEPSGSAKEAYRPLLGYRISFLPCLETIQNSQVRQFLLR